YHELFPIRGHQEIRALERTSLGLEKPTLPLGEHLASAAPAASLFSAIRQELRQLPGLPQRPGSLASSIVGAGTRHGFPLAYADQVERDYAALKVAARQGKIVPKEGRAQGRPSHRRDGYGGAATKSLAFGSRALPANPRDGNEAATLPRPEPETAQAAIS